MTWWTYVEAHAQGDRQVEIATKVGVDQTMVSRWKAGKTSPQPEPVAAFARAYGRPVLEAFVAAGFLSAEEAGARVVVMGGDTLDDYDDLELLDALRHRYIERVTRDGHLDDESEEQGLVVELRRRAGEQYDDSGTTVPEQARAAANEDDTLEAEGIAQLEDP